MIALHILAAIAIVALAINSGRGSLRTLKAWAFTHGAEPALWAELSIVGAHVAVAGFIIFVDWS